MAFEFITTQRRSPLAMTRSSNCYCCRGGNEGYAVLPLLYDESFIGRADIIAERKPETLVVKNIWSENGMKQTHN